MITRSVHLKNRTRVTAIGAALVVAILSSTIAANAAKPRIPASYYPAGTHITYFATLSNHRLDCMWGFFCEGQLPLFHVQTQDQLHRTSGWAQYATWRRHHEKMQFVVYGSTYAAGADSAGTPWSQAAFDDLLLATHVNGYLPLRHMPRLLPATAPGGSIAELQLSGSLDLVVMACWTGSQEVEAIVVFDHRSSSDRKMALRDLAQQVRVAIGAS